jgi:hypothetical protein
MLIKIFHACVAGEKPEELMHDGLEVQFLGGEQWEPGREIEPHLMPENGKRSRTRAIGFGDALVQYVSQQVLVLAHGSWLENDSVGV